MGATKLAPLVDRRWGRSGPPGSFASPVIPPHWSREPESFYSPRHRRVKWLGLCLILLLAVPVEAGDLQEQLRQSRQQEEFLGHLNQLYVDGRYEQVLAELAAAAVEDPSPRLDNLEGMTLADIEVYAQQFEMVEDEAPRKLGEIDVVPVSAVPERGPWIAAEALDLGGAQRATPVRSAAEALLHLAAIGAAADAPDPLYVEGPPISLRADKD